MIKERIREQFIKSCLEEYEEKVARYHISYDKWMRRKEAALDANSDHHSTCLPLEGEVSPKETERVSPKVGREPVDGEGQPRLEPIPFSTLTRTEDGNLSFMEHCIRAADDTVFLFVSDEGTLAPYAETVVLNYFRDHPEAGIVYGDEDVQLSDGTYDDPYFKPGWSPDLYLCRNYIGSVFAVRASFMKRFFMSGLPSRPVPEGITTPQDKLFFRLSVFAEAYGRRRNNVFPIGHIDEVLFHRTAGTDLTGGRGIDSGEIPFFPENTADHLISIIIPSKDNVEMLKSCVEAVRRTSKERAGLLDSQSSSRARHASHVSDQNTVAKCSWLFELLIIDNGSSEENRDAVTAMLKAQTPEGAFTGARYFYAPAPFNFSAMCNLGAEQARGDILLFLNDDVRAVTDDWLTEMLRVTLRPHAGAVGIKLRYPDTGTEENLIQHCGIANVRVGPVHKLQRLNDTEVHYHGYNRMIRDCIAVTGACLMIAKEKFLAAGRFKEDLAVAFNDVELCYTLYEAGYYNICINDAYLIHHESFSRGDDTEDIAKVKRLDEEYHRMMERHPLMYYHDPFYHKYLTDNENIAGNVLQTDIISADEMPYAPVKQRTLRQGRRCRFDPVVRVGVEYAGTVKGYEMKENFRVDEEAEGYYIRGYSFVIGADNAVYERHVLLQFLAEAEGVQPSGNRYFAAKCEDVYRPDIEARIANQTHVALTGFHTRIKHGAIPPGRYRVGILAADIVTGVKLYYFGTNLLTVK